MAPLGAVTFQNRPTPLAMFAAPVSSAASPGGSSVSSVNLRQADGAVFLGCPVLCRGGGGRQKGRKQDGAVKHEDQKGRFMPAGSPCFRSASSFHPVPLRQPFPGRP